MSLTRILKYALHYAGLGIAWATAYAYTAFVIVASVVAALCFVAIFAFIILEGFALVTGNG